MSDQVRRWKVCSIPANAPSGLEAVLLGRARIVNLPEDARVERMSFDPATDCVLFAISSATFEPIPWGQRFPDFELRAETIAA